MRIPATALLIVSILGFAPLSAQTPIPSKPPGAFVQVDGSQLYYEECGSGPRAVILLHDGVVNSAVWDDVWPAFCKQFHTIRYDRRGYGRSPETKKPYYEADDLAALLRERKISQAALVASSHGGNVALDFAIRYPAQICDLVLVGPAAEGFPYSEHFIMAWQAFQHLKDPVEVRAQNTYFIAPGNDAAREHLRSLLKASPQDHTHGDMPLPEKPVFPYVQDLRTPTLILVGAADIADNQAVAGALVMAIPGAARVVVPDTGHLMYLEKPETFFALVSEFLDSHGF
ncbi:MAG: alpha/beta hydrolase [Terracidiphilus sp.]